MARLSCNERRDAEPIPQASEGMDADGRCEPFVLTVEEPAALLRISRSAAYAMAREWRRTGGTTGLPVVEIGRALRVPRRAFLEFLGAV